MISRICIGVLVMVAQASLTLADLVHVGSLTDSLRSPACVAVAPDGTVLVSDPFNNHIARFDAGGTFLGAWDVPEGPVGLAVHPDGRYFVSLRDTGQVGIYDSGFNFLGYLGDGDPLVDFQQPTDIAVASTGEIYVVDGEGDRVYGFAADGSVILLLGARGGGSGEFRYPSAVAVDEAHGRLLVGDHDNFRVQAFTTGGVFEMQFGYRLKFEPGMPSEGWMPRTQGLAVDAAGRVYVVDALMSTVRVFAVTGSELDKVVEYGFDVGDVRTPGDVALSPDGSLLYVVSTNTSSVEIYETPSWRTAKPMGAFSGGSKTIGTNWSYFDAVRTGALRADGQNGMLIPKGAPTVAEILETLSRTSFDGPHMVEDSPVICGRCHGYPDLPGGHEGLVEGQGVLCMSCHTAGGQGLEHPVHEIDQSVSHPWGVPAVDEEVGSLGPTPGGPLALYLDNGNIKCTTCHDQHTTFYGPYLRTWADQSQLCKDCHRADDGPKDHAEEHTKYCLDCHDPHSTGDNLHLVGESFFNWPLQTTVEVTFTDNTVGVGPGAFVDPDPDVYGICEACHDYPAGEGPHTLDPSMPVCTLCHQHRNGFEIGFGDLAPGEYVGVETCGMCHVEKHAEWMETIHSSAFDNLPPFAQDPAMGCVECHTVGFGDPTGFVDHDTTPELEGVQCENCHGPGSGHVSNPMEEHPTIDKSAALCGSCHTDAHHPTYDEWQVSGHADTAEDSHGISSCFVCHAPLGEQGEPPELLNVECVACHDAHAQTGNDAVPDPEGVHDAQLLVREIMDPLPAPTNDPALVQDGSRFELCGQCHHSRGRTWEATSRGPHHSLQVNTFIGEMPVPEGTPDLVPPIPSVHAGLEKQCNTCHMHTEPFEEGPPEVPAVTGHSWAVDYDACADCHGSAEAAEQLEEAVQASVMARLAAIEEALGDPATWEYSCCGGPEDQSTIPDDIKKARFLLKYAENDGSFGVHNGAYTDAILSAAEDLLGIPPARTYVGSPTCGACHPDEAALQNVHGHAHKLTPVSGGPPEYPAEGIFAGVPEPPAGATWDDVSYVIGGYYRKARFVTLQGNIMIGATGGFDGAMGVETQWNLEFPPGGTGLNWAWYHESDTQPKPYNYSCFRCHTTGPQEDPGGFEDWAEPSVQCEACHGPGSDHLLAPGPDTIEVDTSAALCGTCHTRGDDPQVVLASGGYIRHHEQWPELLASPHHFLECATCHEPHTSAYYQPESAIKLQCTTCHPGMTMHEHEGETFHRGDYTEEITCVSCHMPYATKSATAADASVVGPLGRMGDIKSHIFNINTDPVDYTAMFTPDGSALLKNGDGEGAVTLDFACLRCHNGIGNAPEFTLEEAAQEANGFHD